MGYRNGVWVADGSPDPRGNKTSNKDHKRGDDDISRAIRSEQTSTTRTTTTGTGPMPQTYQGTGAALLGGVASGAGAGAGRVDRPIIAGGCQHNGTKVALTLSDGKRIYGSRGMDLQATGHLDLVIDCAGLVNGRKFVKASNNPRYRTLNPFAFPDVITLAWPDMTAPGHVGIRFWIRLREMLPQATCIACMGSHGRTGTAMAALLVADGVGGTEAIARVRKEHCPRAIETIEQENYIKRLAVEYAAVKGVRG